MGSVGWETVLRSLGFRWQTITRLLATSAPAFQVGNRCKSLLLTRQVCELSIPAFSGAHLEPSTPFLLSTSSVPPHPSFLSAQTQCLCSGDPGGSWEGRASLCFVVGMVEKGMTALSRLLVMFWRKADAGRMFRNHRGNAKPSSILLWASFRIPFSVRMRLEWGVLFKRKATGLGAGGAGSMQQVLKTPPCTLGIYQLSITLLWSVMGKVRSCVI